MQSFFSFAYLIKELPANGCLSGGVGETTTANQLLTLQIAPAFARGEAAVRCSGC